MIGTGDKQMIVPAPSGVARRLVLGFVFAFLALQLLLPLSYYATGSGSDERFAWRMFSPVAARKCEPFVFEASEAGAESLLPLRSTVQTTWVGLLRRQQRPVVHELLQWRCEESAARSVRYELRCTAPDGSELEPVAIPLNCDRER